MNHTRSDHALPSTAVLLHGIIGDRRVPSDMPPAGNANHADASDAEHQLRRHEPVDIFKIFLAAGTQR